MRNSKKIKRMTIMNIPVLYILESSIYPNDTSVRKPKSVPVVYGGDNTLK